MRDVGEGSQMESITSDMLIRDILTHVPGAAEVFEKHGLACGACLAAGMESLAAVATVHDVRVDDLLRDLVSNSKRSGDAM